MFANVKDRRKRNRNRRQSDIPCKNYTETPGQLSAGRIHAAHMGLSRVEKSEYRDHLIHGT